MLVLKTLTGKEIKTNNYLALKKLQKEYDKKGSNTHLIYGDLSDKMWKLRVIEKTGYFADRMGARYNP